MTTITCNRCQKKFQASEVQYDDFNGQSAARVYDFLTCPSCDQTDHHWVYASDVMPKFTGTKYQIKMQEQDWKDSH